MAKNATYVCVGEPGEQDKKLAPQAQAILDIVKSKGSQGIRGDQLVEEMKQKVSTKQPTDRVLVFYQKGLVEAGYLRIDKDPAPPKKSKAKKEKNEGSNEQSS